MNITEYLEELTDQNWHTLRELIELERGELEPEKADVVINAYECAIAYLQWHRYYKHTPLMEVILDRLDRQ